MPWYVHSIGSIRMEQNERSRKVLEQSLLIGGIIIIINLFHFQIFS